jgi:hypothetical protein
VLLLLFFYLKELLKKSPAMPILFPRKYFLVRMLDRPSKAWVGHIRQPRRARVANLFTGMARAQQGEPD